MFGFLINAGSVIIGSLIGLLFRRIIKKEYCDATLKVMGICIILIGILGVIENTYVNNNGEISFSGTFLLTISLAIGSFIGEFLKIDTHFNNLSLKLEKKLNKGAISEGFISATLIYCIGAMTIVGTLNDTLGNSEMIVLKSILDGITSIVLASTLGIGVCLSCVSVFVIQGLLTLIFALLGNAVDISQYMDLIKSLGMVGYAIVIAIGYNFLSEKKIKVANLLPSLLIPIIYYVGVLWLG